MIARPIPPTGLSLASPQAAVMLSTAWDALESAPLPDSDVAGWLLITQPDHAALSGELARHWGNDFFVPPAPHDEVTAAIAHHDDGWRERDGVPRWSAATRGPENFLVLAPEDFVSNSRRSIQHARTRSPLAGYMVSWHFLQLASARSAVDRAFAGLPVIREFLAEQPSLQSQWRDEFRALFDEALEQACRLLQFSDMLSIYLCLGALENVTLPQEFLTRAGAPVRLALHYKPESGVALSPYPFDCSPLRIELRGRRLRQAFFRDKDELARAFTESEQETIAVEIRPGG